MRLITQLFLIEKYGLRLNMEQLAEVLGCKIGTLHNKINDAALDIPTYVDGGKRWADYEDVAKYLDTLKEKASV